MDQEAAKIKDLVWPVPGGTTGWGAYPAGPLHPKRVPEQYQDLVSLSCIENGYIVTVRVDAGTMPMWVVREGIWFSPNNSTLPGVFRVTSVSIVRVSEQADSHTFQLERMDQHGS